MKEETHQFRPDVFTQLKVVSKERSRIIAYCTPNALRGLNFSGIEDAIGKFMDSQSIKKGTYGIVASSEKVNPQTVRDAVTNIRKKRLTCVWAIASSEVDKTFFGVHSVFAVKTTPNFEAECQNLLKLGYKGECERKLYHPFLEFAMIKMNPAIALSVYNPSKALAKMTRAD